MIEKKHAKKKVEKKSDRVQILVHFGATFQFPELPKPPISPVKVTLLADKTEVK